MDCPTSLSVCRLMNVKCLRVKSIISSHHHQLQMRSYRDAYHTFFSIILSVSLKNTTKPPSASPPLLGKIGMMIQHCSNKVRAIGFGDGRWSLQCMLVKKHPFIPFHPSTLWLIVVCMPIANCKLTAAAVAADLLWYDFWVIADDVEKRAQSSVSHHHHVHIY